MWTRAQIRENGGHTWQYADSEIDKLADKRVKAFFLVNPSDPPSFAMRESSMRRLVDLVKRKKNGAISSSSPMTCMARLCRLPLGHGRVAQNTIGVDPVSKHFGCTGWRLGVVAIHEDNIFDKMLAKLPPNTRAALNRRYTSITLQPAKMKFIDRMVADSRMVSLNHTAGLSLPQQIQMALFSSFALLDKSNSYKSLCRLIVRRRFRALLDGLGLSLPEDNTRAAYYVELTSVVWAEKEYGPEFAKFLRRITSAPTCYSASRNIPAWC